MAESSPGHRPPDQLRGPSLTGRRLYLDVLRGVAVVIMVLAHVTDAWTREADRFDTRYFVTVFINGLAAPMFLMLAGLALVLAADRRAHTLGAREAARSVRRRGWQVFALAFLFRAQSQLLGWGPLINFLKVDILNIMGLSMVIAGGIRAIGDRTTRLWVYAAVTASFALLYPLVRSAAWLDAAPDPLEAYVRSIPGRTSFALFPWVGFLTAGALVGELLTAAADPTAERRVHGRLAAAAGGGVLLAIVLSFLPSPCPESTFWSTSPLFFAIRLGLVLAPIPLAWAFHARWEPLVTMGRSSLFVYWVHVEIAYGSAAVLLKRALPWEVSMLSGLALCVLLYHLVHLKDAWLARRPLPRRLEFLAPVLK